MSIEDHNKKNAQPGPSQPRPAGLAGAMPTLRQEPTPLQILETLPSLILETTAPPQEESSGTLLTDSVLMPMPQDTSPEQPVPPLLQADLPPLQPAGPRHSDKIGEMRTILRPEPAPDLSRPPPSSQPALPSVAALQTAPMTLPQLSRPAPLPTLQTSSPPPPNLQGAGTLPPAPRPSEITPRRAPAGRSLAAASQMQTLITELPAQDATPLTVPPPKVDLDRTNMMDRPALPVAKGDDLSSTAILKTPLLEAAITDTSATKPAATEHTEIRPIFQRFSSTQVISRTTGTGRLRESLLSPRLLLTLLGLLVVGGGSWLGYSYYQRASQQAAQVQDAHNAFNAALDHGRLSDFVAAEASLRKLIDSQPTEQNARSARALILAAARYEFGGGPQLSDGTDWEVAAQSASRQSESEHSAAAEAALAFAALAQADSPGTLQHANLLAQSPPSDEFALPRGLVGYLQSQAALLAGRDDEALSSLQQVVQAQRLPLWQRRLGYLQLRRGQLAEASATLQAVLREQPDLIGATIDLALLRGLSGDHAAQATAKQTLLGLMEPPRSGPELCGPSERARATLLLAELTLASDPMARAEARALLHKAQALVPTGDLLLLEEVARAQVGIGDNATAATLQKQVLARLPDRRRSRLLLAQALLATGLGTEADSILAPLTSGPTMRDAEATVLKGQALLLQSDTLAAQKLTRLLLANPGLPAAVRYDTQLLSAQVFLTLQEPLSARRVLEPLLKLAVSPVVEGKTPQPTREQKLSVQVLSAQTLLALRPPQQSEARALLESVVGQAPERADARLLLGRLLRELGAWSPAEQQLSAALRMDERSIPVRRELAMLLMLRGDFAKARELYTELLKDEQDAELVLAAARAERLDGAPDLALQTLAKLKRSRGELTTKHDEALLAERAKILLALERHTEAVSLLQPLMSDLLQLRSTALASLLISAHLALAEPPQKQAELLKARAVLTQVQQLKKRVPPPPWSPDTSLQLAEVQLLLAEGNKQTAGTQLTALVGSIHSRPPGTSATSDELLLNKQAEKLLVTLKGPLPATKPATTTAAMKNAPGNRR